MLLIALTIKSVSDPRAVGQFIVDGKPLFYLVFRVEGVNLNPSYNSIGKMSLNHCLIGRISYRLKTP